MEVSIVPNDFQTSLFDIDLIRLFQVSYQPRPRDLQYVKIWGRIILWFDRYIVSAYIRSTEGRIDLRSLTHFWV